MSDYKTLRAINVNDHVDKKNGLSYLSWAWAWDEFKQAYPDATYKVVKTADGLPYFETHAGVMVYTEVTAGGLTHEMWLPVMDGANKAMKREPYTYKTKYADKACDAFDMFDVNKTIMRCLVKNLAMFGLGIYIYAGDDLPEDEMEAAPPKKAEPAPLTFAQPHVTNPNPTENVRPAQNVSTPVPAGTPAPSIQGSNKSWSISVTADPNADKDAWIDAVNEALLSTLTFAQTEDDLKAIFKINKVIFDTYKAFDLAQYNELTDAFAARKEKIKEKINAEKAGA